MLAYYKRFSDVGVIEWFRVMFHGLPLDLSMSGYLSAFPGLLLIAAIWTRSNALKWIGHVYMGIVAFFISLTFCLNIALYEYWGFPLDSTPLFYFFSSPSDAVASVSMVTVILGVLLALAIAVGIFYALRWTFLERDKKPLGSGAYRVKSTVLMTVLVGLLFLPIRGGITVSAMNTGEVYFSTDMKLNHAAVNPFFSIMESLSHQEDFAEQYRFMDGKKADKLFAKMIYTKSDSTKAVINNDRPDVYIVIMESFSEAVMKTNALPNINKLKNEGIYFTNFYANSFRTDRGTLAILSGYPAQPTMSLMKYPKKTNNLPSISKKLSKAGYGLKYYYGGDADFTNMRSYLTSMGFADIVADVDFPINERLGKWGVPDHLVFNRLEKDLKAEKQTKQPMMRVLQTSSSHEPFDVPYHKLGNKVLNAFAYADHSVGNFISFLKKSGRWKKSLVILVPDHLGCYPEGISNFVIKRYQIPMIWLGGAIDSPQKINVYGSQQDIAATLLGQLKLDHSDIKFSKDMLDAKAPHFAFFTVPDAWGMATADNRIIYDNTSNKIMLNEGKRKSLLLNSGKAYLQKLYDDISKR
ncbi:sulfatase [Prevotella herbatica]|uniref:Sulfatase n=2 Tax=Prevotella herbatica TaxID=2801997 RepID=A0ABN6EMP9_9BACT|nr:sulfatase [Prevotella herbatica]